MFRSGLNGDSQSRTKDRESPQIKIGNTVRKWVTRLLRDLEFFQDSAAYVESKDDEGLLEDIIFKVRKKKKELDIEEATGLD